MLSDSFAQRVVLGGDLLQRTGHGFNARIGEPEAVDHGRGEVELLAACEVFVVFLKQAAATVADSPGASLQRRVALGAAAGGQLHSRPAGAGGKLFYVFRCVHGVVPRKRAGICGGERQGDITGF